MSIRQGNGSAEDHLGRSTSVEFIATSWCMLPPHIRETIVTLVDAGLLANRLQTAADDTDTEGNL